MLRERGLTVHAVEDRSWMWRVINPAQLAAKLRVPEQGVRQAGFFDEILPAARSRYWLSDRF